MVQLMSSGKKSAVKFELHDSLEDQLGPLHKRGKFKQEFETETTAFTIPPSMYNPLEEPSPLGLRLKKTPSFLDLIEMKLSQENASKLVNLSKKRGNAVSAPADKLKASNFPASLLKIGSWEYTSRYEGDLVGKCYFAKHKLVWEVLDGGLKNKIEIQWSDIVAIKASYPEDAPGTLDVVLARQPLFFRETNPQPRKHTLWQATADFTGGQASIHRRHFLICPPGMLGKHFEKLIQCDPRLNFLSQQPEVLLESPYFESRLPAFDEPDVSSHSKREEGAVSFDLQHAASPSGVQTSSSNIEQKDFIDPSSSSVIDTCDTGEIRSTGTKECKMLGHWDQIKIPGIHPSMSMSDLVNHIGNCISEQRISGTSIIPQDDLQANDIMEEITQYLLSDTQVASASDEKSLMSRVNSLCCLLHKDSTTAQSMQTKSSDGVGLQGDGNIGETNSTTATVSESKVGKSFCAPESESADVSGCKQPPGMSRKDSIAELLHNLPRIASFPQFLFNITEDSHEER
ncbi:ATP-dependent DNA helicase [Melia azedarach]|uniref:ATP-dependent DNA helicase n=1 Tax=Melia azedarach TaxID=155640 RepID=A0ACC1Y5F2_MELAZ|nr:ATP-dependent DNA helicase [Melia azedarach]